MALVESVERIYAGHWSAPRFPAAFHPLLAPGDQEAEPVAPAGNRALGAVAGQKMAGMTFGIEYKSGKNQTRRRITVKNVEQSEDGKTTIRAHCYETGRVLTFHSDRIMAFWDWATGDVVKDLNGYLAHLGHLAEGTSKTPRPDQEWALDLIRDGLRILMFLARADGVLDAAELAVIADYIRVRCQEVRPALAADSPGLLLDYARRQHPDIETFSACIHRLCERSCGRVLDLTLDTAQRVIQADGVLHAEEIRHIDELRAVIDDYKANSRYLEDYRPY